MFYFLYGNSPMIEFETEKLRNNKKISWHRGKNF